MGDELGDEWWKHSGNNSDVSEDEGEKAVEKTAEETVTKKRKIQTLKPAKAKEAKTECIVSKKEKQEDEKDTKPKRKRKKKITDVLAASAPKPGCPADLQKLFEDNFTDKRSVIEMEELKLPDSCFLPSNDLTHSLSSFLKEICPKWAKLCKNHTEQKSVVMLIVCSSAHRVLDLIKQLTTFKGNAKVLKLFAKHIKVEEQIKLLQKGVTHMGVGTPGRIKALAEQDGLSLKALKYVVLDWNWRDQKLRRMPDIPEVDYTEERECADCYALRLDRANSIIDCACTVSFSLSEAFKGDVFMYYGLTNFHQNQRHYMVSRDNAQLVGRQYNLKNPSITCIPFDKYKNGTPIAPCGAIANSIFNDTLQLFYHPDKNTETPVPLLKTDISWFTDRTVKFQNPSPKDNLSAAFAGTARPFYWWKPVYQLSVEKNNNGFVNEDLIVWMRQAAFPSFKKLYRRLNRTQEFNEGLPAGNYSVKISYNYPVGKFKGRKSVILSTVSWLGGQSNFLGVAYCASGAIILIVAIILTVVHLKFRENSLGLEEE